jgi:hypothetical protein
VPVFKPLIPALIPSSKELARSPILPKALVAVDIADEPAEARAVPSCDASCNPIAEALGGRAEPSIKVLLPDSVT